MPPRYTKEFPSFPTVPSVIAHYAEHEPDRLMARFLRHGDKTVSLTYRQAWQLTLRWAAALAERGVGRHTPVLVALSNTEDFVGAYYGTLVLGGIPAPVAPFRKIRANEPYLRTIAERIGFLGAKVLVVPSVNRHIAETPPYNHLSGFEVVTAADVPDVGPERKTNGSPGDLGVLQFTSGTIAAAKAVMLSHEALLHQAKLISAALFLEDCDVDSACSWLPLFHDMGLIGYMLTPSIHAGTVTLLQTEDFALRPESWINAIAETKASITGGPPSAFALTARRMKSHELHNLDLSHVRVALVGAEMVTSRALEQFMDVFGPHGFRRRALIPTYGMAENGLAVTISLPDTPPVFDSIDAAHLQLGEARPIPADEGSEFAGLGVPLTGVQLVVRDAVGKPLPERHIGEITVRSPTLMQGYFRQPEMTAQALRDGWFYTGDMGYLADGQLFITGRKKEVLIVGGRNFYPGDLEAAVALVPGVRMKRAVAISYFDEERATEAIAILAETALTDPAACEKLRLALRRTLLRSGYPVSDVVLLPPRTIEMTRSGKVKRVALRQRYIDGELHAHIGQQTKATGQE